MCSLLAERRIVVCLGMAALIVAVTADRAAAHDARPLSIAIVEGQDGRYRVETRVPPSVEAENRPEIAWPERCRVQQAGVRESAAGVGVSTLLACTDGLAGRRITVEYPLFNPSLSTLVRFTTEGGAVRTAVLPPDVTTWTVPDVAGWSTIAGDYLVLGVEHIWAGVDHLLFVIGLLLLAGTPRRITIAVTGFTLAHSITLSLSALDLVRVPVPPVEAAIALSILFLANEVAGPGRQTLARRFPLAVAASFGLLHGFGFAAALTDAGLPHGEIAPALLFFNAGVEVGQLLFIGAVLMLLAAARRVIACVRDRSSRAPAPAWASAAGAYALGVPAAFWFLERVQAIWAG